MGSGSAGCGSIVDMVAFVDKKNARRPGVRMEYEIVAVQSYTDADTKLSNINAKTGSSSTIYRIPYLAYFDGNIPSFSSFSFLFVKNIINTHITYVGLVQTHKGVAVADANIALVKFKHKQFVLIFFLLTVVKYW